jgi:probable H4MPT-linked C1 transfer pathway protein
MSWLGLDIGGANLKAADGRGWARTVPFALWRDPAGLADALAALVSQAPAADRLAVTMTGELCDSFRTKAEGVRHILAAVERAAAGRAVHVYLVDGRFAAVAAAREQPHLAAASNWHALARFACRYTEGRAALLVDIGSTTTDLVPLVDGWPATTALTDSERLVTGELVYMGVGRTPLCAVTRTLPWQGQQCPVAAELFATTADAYVLVGDLPEQPDALGTADGRPLTKEFARERMARMVCADATTFSNDDAQRAAQWVRQTQIAQLRAAIATVISTMPRPPEVWVTSGSGEFLARQLEGTTRIVSLGAELGPDVSSAAAAHSVARLAAETAGI